ncbi:MAG: helix-turn-helix domain-containing protein [Desulfomonilaceae bacterium]
MKDVYFTISQVADRVHKSEQSVIRWIKSGKLPFYQVSERRRIISQLDLQTFIDNRKVTSPPKRFDKCGTVVANSPISSLTTSGERKAEMDVKSLRKEISQLCQL